MTAIIKHKYLKGKHKGVFNRAASKVYDVMILTESIIDAMSLIELGFENVQALYGTNGFTDEHLQILKADRVKLVVLAFDNDDAGIKAAEKLKERLLLEGFEVKVIFPPAQIGNNGSGIPCKDWNDFLVNSRDKGVIEKLIESAEVHNPEEGEEDGFSAVKNELGYIFTARDMIYRLSGVKEVFVSNLKVNIKAELKDFPEDKFYDNLDLYSARSRNSYSLSLSRMFNLDPKRIEKDLIEILEYLEKERDRNLSKDEDKRPVLSSEDEKLGMEFLKSEDMRQQIRDDLETMGYVGEERIKELMYYCATSRLMDNPISVMIISQSASGKSMLTDSVRKLMPPEDVIWVTSLSNQALNYAKDLDGKFLVLGEAVHSEDTQHQIREMLSARELSRFVTLKDKTSGEMVSSAKPKTTRVAAAITGTREDVNPENLSRFFLANMDESKDQTKRIHKTHKGKHTLKRYYTKKDRIPEVIRKHHAAQRLLKPRIIHNPIGEHLDFPANQIRTRRDHERFIDLIAVACFLRQYQKEVKIDPNGLEYIECDLEDYEIAYDIMVNGVLSSSLTDIPLSAIEFYENMRKLSREFAKKNNLKANEVSLTQRDIREYTGFGLTWVKKNLKILIDYEYVFVAKGGHARSKGFYQIREDEDMEKLNISMIPTPERIRKIMENGI